MLTFGKPKSAARLASPQPGDCPRASPTALHTVQTKWGTFASWRKFIHLKNNWHPYGENAPMISKRSKIALVCVALLANVLLFVFFYGVPNPQILAVPIWKFDLLSRYYVVNANWAASNAATLNFANLAAVLPVPEHEVKKELARQIKLEGGEALTQIEAEVKETYAEEFKDTLKKQIKADIHELQNQLDFFNAQKSWKLQNQMIGEYLRTNGEKLKNEIVKDILRDTSDESLKKKISELPTLGDSRASYFRHIFRDILIPLAPAGTGVMKKWEKVFLNLLREVTQPPKSKTNLLEGRVELLALEIDELQSKHDELVGKLRQLETPATSIFSGSGIVITTGQSHFIGALNVLIQAREMGSELPAEILIDSHEHYNKQFCESTLPKFNAKCLIVEEQLTPDLFKALDAKGFSIKVVSLLVSSFDNIIYLDSDTFPIKNVDRLLESEPFLKTRFLLWPDMWHKGTSPLYYQIARFEVGEPVRRDGTSNEDTFASYVSRDKDTQILFHDLEGVPPFTGVELGQLVISKREHFRSLILALYYNLNGPTYYYPLLYQGVFGSGDRETFVPALHVMKEPYYLNEYEMTFSGVMREKVVFPGEFYFDESTMIQRDPEALMKFKAAWKRFLAEKNLDTRLNPFQNGDYTKELLEKFFTEYNRIEKPAAFFLHIHDPKINSVFNELSKKTRYDYKSRYVKELGQHEDILGTADWELKFQAINAWTTCEGLTDKHFWEVLEVDQAETCKKTKEYVEILKESSNDKAAADLDFLKPKT